MLRHLERFPLMGERPLLAFASALALSVMALWLRLAVDTVLPPGYPFLTFFPAVVLSAFFFGRGPGVLAAFACGVFAWYFFVAPIHSFGLTSGTAMALGFYGGVVAVDIALIHWMQRANARLRDERERNRELAEERGALVDRAELLFRELQHRVANNVQMAGAVLALQKRGVSDPAARKALDDAAERLQLVGRIQRQLYSTAGELVPMDVFLAELASDLIAAAGKPGVTHAIDAEPGVQLVPDAAIPVALIMAEAVANAIEHGFGARDTGHVAIRLARRDGAIELSVHDDGVGVGEGFDFEGSTSLGLRVARTLAQSLKGRLELSPAATGTVMRLVLPIASISPAAPR